MKDKDKEMNLLQDCFTLCKTIYEEVKAKGSDEGLITETEKRVLELLEKLTLLAEGEGFEVCQFLVCGLSKKRE